MEVRVLEKVVTVSGKEKCSLKSHFVMRMMEEDMQYHEKRVAAVRRTRNRRFGWAGRTKVIA